MHEKYTSIAFFEQYLEGTLNEEEKLDFETQLSNTPEIAASFELYKKILKGLTLSDKDVLQNTIQSIHKKLDKEGFFVDEDTIGDYLEGNLDPNEQAKFKTRIASDPTFAQKVAFEKKLLKGIAHSDEVDLLKNLGDIQSKLDKEDFFAEKKTATKEKTPSKVISLWRRYRPLAAAASVLLILGLFWIFSQQPSGQEVFATHFKKEVNYLPPLLDELSTVGLIDTDREQKTNLYEALSLYQEENYIQAITALETHLQTYPNDLNAQLYLGISYLHQQTPAKAVKILEPLIENPDEAVQYPAKWYLALSYLTISDQEDTGKKLLQEIAASDTYFQHMATNVLQELK